MKITNSLVLLYLKEIIQTFPYLVALKYLEIRSFF